MKTQFRFTCSYIGCIWYNVTDESGTYSVEFRHCFSDYESSISNGDDVRRDCRDAIGILRREHCSDSDMTAWRLDKRAPCFAVSQSTVDAFNAWRAEERASHLAKMKADPARYGENSESVFSPIIPARRGWYVSGAGWQWEGKETIYVAA